jgi:hypothetical protein
MWLKPIALPPPSAKPIFGLAGNDAATVTVVSANKNKMIKIIAITPAFNSAFIF